MFCRPATREGTLIELTGQQSDRRLVSAQNKDVICMSMSTYKNTYVIFYNNESFTKKYNIIQKYHLSNFSLNYVWGN